MTERDSHFMNAARLIYPKLDELFLTLDARIMEHRPIEEIDAIEDEIRTLLAQFLYDFASHLVEQMNYGLDTHTVEDALADIPDMTEWPKQE